MDNGKEEPRRFQHCEFKSLLKIPHSSYTVIFSRNLLDSDPEEPGCLPHHQVLCLSRLLCCLPPPHHSRSGQVTVLTVTLIHTAYLSSISLTLLSSLGKKKIKGRFSTSSFFMIRTHLGPDKQSKVFSNHEKNWRSKVS